MAPSTALILRVPCSGCAGGAVCPGVLESRRKRRKKIALEVSFQGRPSIQSFKKPTERGKQGQRRFLTREQRARTQAAQNGYKPSNCDFNVSSLPSRDFPGCLKPTGCDSEARGGLALLWYVNHHSSFPGSVLQGGEVTGAGQTRPLTAITSLHFPEPGGDR